MTTRCQHHTFYLAGVKVTSGEATAMTPTGNLQVVCRTAGPGQINVQEIPDGTPLNVPRIGVFPFDASAWQGKQGRAVDVVARAAGLHPEVRTAYLRRVAATRTDLPAVLAVLGADRPISSPTLQAMMRRNRAHWPAIVDAALAGDAAFTGNWNLGVAVAAIDNPVLLHHLASRPMKNRDEFDIAAIALTQLATLGYGRDAGTIMAGILSGLVDRQGQITRLFIQPLMALDNTQFASLAAQLLAHDPEETIGAMLTASVIQSDENQAAPADRAARVAALSQTMRTIDTSSWRQPAVDALPQCILYLDQHLEHLNSLETERVRRETNSTPTAAHIPSAWGKLGDDELLEQFVVATTKGGRHHELAATALEIVKRPLPNHPTLKHPDVKWMRLLHRSGLFSDQQLCEEFWQTSHRAQAVQTAPAKDLAFILDDYLEVPPSILLAVLQRFDDPVLWHRHVVADAHPAQRRLLLERAPLDVLTQLATSPKTKPYGVVSEVAVYRGAITPEVAFSSSHATVRVAAVLCARDDAVLSAALHDADEFVQISAVRRSRDISGLADLRTRLTDSASMPAATRAAEIDDRISQLRLSELVELSMQRQELEVARAALAGITSRDLLNDLVVHAALLPYLAQRFEQVTKRPKRRSHGPFR